MTVEHLVPPRTSRVRRPLLVDDAPWWFWWCVSRIIALSVAYASRGITSGDPTYYLSSLARAGDVGWAYVLPEYPLPLVLALWPLHLVADAGAPPRVVVGVTLLAVDLAFCIVLRRRLGDGAARYWTWGVVLAGPVALQRLDLIPGVLLAAALITQGPRARGALLALGTAAKVFPVVGLPAAVVATHRGRRVAGATVIVGASLGVISAAVGGWERLLSPLTYQSDRGLQVESVVATPFVLLQLVDRGQWVSAYSSSSKSFEVTGPGSGTALTLATAAQIVVMVLVVALACLVAWRRRVARAERGHRQLLDEHVLWATVAAVAGLVVTSRVFSPQYVLWLLPLAAVTHASRSRFARRWAAAFLVTLGLTQLLYPLLYGGILGSGWSTWPASIDLALRNVVIVALWLCAAWRAVRTAVATVPGDASSQADSVSRPGGRSTGRTRRSGGTSPP
jgi:hypothetical protein